MLASGRRVFRVRKIFPVGKKRLGLCTEGPAWCCALQVRADSPTIGGRRVLLVASRLGISDYSHNVYGTSGPPGRCGVRGLSICRAGGDWMPRAKGFGRRRGRGAGAANRAASPAAEGSASNSEESADARSDGEGGINGEGDVNDAASDASMQESRSSDSGELNDEGMHDGCDDR